MIRIMEAHIILIILLLCKIYTCTVTRRSPSGEDNKYFEWLNITKRIL